MRRIGSLPTGGPSSSNDGGGDPAPDPGLAPPASEPLDGGRKVLKIATVSHTLDAAVAERLRHFAFRERISESAVIEFALRGLFESDEDPALGKRLRDSGAALRRKS